jgi:hypothetical protein
MLAKVILILVFAHCVLDYPLQGSFLASEKSKSNFVLAVHCIIWSLGISIVLMYLGLFAWWKVIMLLVGHYCMDYWKCRGLYKKWPCNTYYKGAQVYHGGIRYQCKDTKEPIISDMQSLYIDQIFHLLQVALCLL